MRAPAMVLRSGHFYADEKTAARHGTAGRAANGGEVRQPHVRQFDAGEAHRAIRRTERDGLAKVIRAVPQLRAPMDPQPALAHRSGLDSHAVHTFRHPEAGGIPRQPHNLGRRHQTHGRCGLVKAGIALHFCAHDPFARGFFQTGWTRPMREGQ